MARSSAAGQVRPPRSMESSFPFTASMNSLLSSQAEVSVDEFADTDSLGHLAHSREEIEEAETIYSIISGYEEAERDSHFLFMEDFSHNSGSPDESREMDRQDTSTEQHENADERTTIYGTPHSSARGSQRRSISSAELLGRLRSVEITSNSGSGSGSGSSIGRFSQSSKSLSSRGGSRVSFSTRSRDSRGLNNLTAGIDSSSALPVTLYTVQDAEHQPNRWSLFAHNNAPQLEVPPVPGSLSLDSANGIRPIPEPEAVHQGPFSQDHSRHSVPTVSTQALRESRISRNSAFGEEYGLPPALPQSSRLSDTEARRSAHNNMYDDSSVYVQENDIEKGPFLQDDEQYNAQPWSKWLFLMIMGLVCVPVYFLLAFGFFDYGGYRHFMPRVPFGPVNRRYFACYTYWQKLWSFVIGLVWTCLVFAAIAIAFGLRARFH